jgi:hypothetical protein
MPMPTCSRGSSSYYMYVDKTATWNLNLQDELQSAHIYDDIMPTKIGLSHVWKKPTQAVFLCKQEENQLCSNLIHFGNVKSVHMT